VIPIQDVVPTSRAPVVTVALAALNVLVFLFGAAVPAGDAAALAVGLFTHSGVAHLLFNVLFLWIFGDNVEDRLGRGALAFCYLACGTVGSLVQSSLGDAAGPAIGASAAIAGVVGAYFVLLPQSKVLILVPVPVSLMEIPAVFFLAMFGMLQFLNFVVMPTATRIDSSPAASLAGLALAFAGGALVSAIRRRPVVW